MNQRCYRDGSEHRAASGDGQSGDSQVGADSSWSERQKGKKRNRPSERYQMRREGPRRTRYPAIFLLIRDSKNLASLKELGNPGGVFGWAGSRGESGFAPTG